MTRDDLKSLRRVYFVVTSKEGFATLSIEHAGADQELTLPVYPSDAVTEAAPLLEPAFGHYALQWRKVMVDDPEDADSRGFFIERLVAPSRIVDPAKGEALSAIAWSHTPDVIRAYYGGALRDVLVPMPEPSWSPNRDDCLSAGEAGIVPYPD